MTDDRRKVQPDDVPRPEARWVLFLSRNFVFIVGIVAVLIYMFTYLENCFGPPIRADGFGYYAYLPAVMIHGDPSFKTLADTRFEGVMPSWTGTFLQEGTGRYLDKYNMGVAVMMAPFFVIAHIVTWLMQSPPGGFEWWRFNHPASGFTLFYQHAAGLAGLVYMLCGLALLKRVLERFFRLGVVLAALAAIVFGTNLLNYGSGETVLSHAYTFFLFAALLFFIPRWYEEPYRRSCTLLLGLLAGLIVLVRVPSVVFLVFIPLYGVTSQGSMGDRIQLLRRRWAACLLMVLIALAVYLPQMILHRYATGSWLINAYGRHGEGFDFLHPQLLPVLISPEAGLFFWSPILLLALPGLCIMRRQAAPLLVPSVIYLLANLYVISSWHMWWFGGGFGHRAFVESYTIMAVGLCSTYAAVRCSVGRALLWLVSISLIGYALFMMKLYYTRELSIYGLDWQALFDIIWLRKEQLSDAVRSWFLR